MAFSMHDAPTRPALGHNLTLGLVDVLGHAIIAGQFAGGVLPTEPELERRFAISRSVVREAVKMLAAKGLVVTRPRQGTVIEPESAWNLFDPLVLRWMVDGAPAPGVLRQLCEFSMSIEPAAAAAAALGGSVRDHAALVAACDGLAAAGQHPLAWRDATVAFHAAVIPRRETSSTRICTTRSPRRIACWRDTRPPAARRRSSGATEQWRMRSACACPSDRSRRWQHCWRLCSNRWRAGPPRLDQTRGVRSI